MKKILSAILIISMLCGVVAFSGCNGTVTEYGDDDYKSLVASFNSSHDDNELCKIVLTDFDKQYYGDLQKYGELLFLCAEDKREDLFEIFKEELKKRIDTSEKVSDSVCKNTYDSVMWSFVLSSFYDSGFEAVNAKNIKTVLELLRKCAPNFYAADYYDSCTYMDKAVSSMPDAENLRESAYNLINMFSYEASKEEQNYMYMYLSDAYTAAGNTELYFYFYRIMQSESYNTEKTEDGAEDSGRISSLIFDNVEKNLEELVSANTCGYSDICNKFLASPKNVFGDGSLFMLYNEDYYIPIYGSPIYAAAAVDRSTGEIVISY